MFLRVRHDFFSLSNVIVETQAKKICVTHMNQSREFQLSCHSKLVELHWMCRIIEQFTKPALVDKVYLKLYTSAH